MARPKKITDELILEAAKALFMELGAKATTAKIAERAGVSEGLLFKRFKCKNDLFLASMGQSAPDWFSEIDADFEGSVEGRLVDIATQMVALLKKMLPIVEVMVAQNPAHKFHEHSPPVVALRHLAAFFTNLEARGYRVEHPEVLARVFMGSVHHFAFSSLKGIDEFCPCSEPLYIEQMVSMIIGSMDKIEKGE